MQNAAERPQINAERGALPEARFLRRRSERAPSTAARRRRPRGGPGARLDDDVLEA